MNNTYTKRSFKAVREEKGFSIEYIAELTGISIALLDQYESSPEYTPLPLAAQLSSIYNTPLSHIDFI